MKATALLSRSVPRLAAINSRELLDRTDFRQTPHMIVIEAKNEYSAADLELRPISLPVIMVEPERDTPGIRAKV